MAANRPNFVRLNACKCAHNPIPDQYRARRCAQKPFAADHRNRSPAGGWSYFIGVYPHEPWLPPTCALTRELVERNSIFLDRANHRRSLVKIAPEFGERRLDLFAGKIGDRLRFRHFSVGILAVSRYPEPYRSAVFFVLAHEQILDFCSPADGDEQRPVASGSRVPQWPTFLFESATRDSDNVMGRHP